MSSSTRNSLLCVILTTFLVVGCTNQSIGQVGSSAAVAPSMPASAQVSQEIPAAEDVQNVTEQQLVMLFQGLIVMDRQPLLALTAEQSRSILPIVRKSEEEGSIDESERKAVIQVLTKEQKAYLDEQSKQLKQRIAERVKAHREALTAAERERYVTAFEKRRKSEQQIEAGVSERVNSDAPSPDSRGLGISVEQQLIELLVSKS
ncbi:hypothetical protein [Paenibacillus qinlingensis]|uniref:Glutamate-1-semialdehyde aminotransferase n=1 Tax=Paenibacillus qinlingensis TaxID=1837343 RepID=A0ABU1NRH3_9BACL|nr:hypothetical protein [Paenibacillus qinlingensis]MDR6549617.1 glutamate-1-semialdehyde aminotransferase [Paenibacillus qinlingensis]